MTHELMNSAKVYKLIRIVILFIKKAFRHWIFYVNASQNHSVKLLQHVYFIEFL